MKWKYEQKLFRDKPKIKSYLSKELFDINYCQQIVTVIDEIKIKNISKTNF